MFLGAEVRRARDEQEAAHLLRAVRGGRGGRGLVPGGPPRDKVLAVGPQSRAASPCVRITGLPCFC